MTTPVRLAHVDDHETVQLGLGALLEGEPDLRLVVSGGSVDDIADRLHEVDLVVLDLRLSDGSSVTDNVERLRDGGVDVVAFTAADDPAELRTASRAGVLAVIRKSEDRATILDALRRAGAGEVVATTEWAAALDGDPELDSLAAPAPGTVAFDELGQRLRFERAAFSATSGAVALPADVADAVVEATAEAVRNSVRHGGDLSTCSVRLSELEGRGIRVVVADDGRGFDPRAVPPGRLGIRLSMQGRLAAVGGTATVTSAPGSGTEVVIEWTA